ncbi:ABC transporter substrate-binding protein [Tropicibacter naphthalenivorans]|uniref:Thiamine pyrimidine synthase n=1 Tax=Tropicibacter naphthalenivorans TaxID=441103 RepID=A0A0P1GW93_9RHOB|nr:ABC transporter substrate-binding protein [Tropicibacter naphthalenivorans]CUH80964.1 NMT1/THI5 like protein [Tropicibacter naphthalenivorans]SMC91445.1 NitT/TauT family transport system substrate-binding protein [Tropicibacter naphthalenivorans]
MDRFLVSATGHSLNYLPHYIANEQGFFAQEGLEVTEVVPRPWDLVLDHIRDGDAEAALGGIWVPSMFHGRGRRLVPFAQVSNRAPLALIGRHEAPAFDAQALVGKTVLMKGSNGASVGMYLKMMLREAGVDPAAVNYIQDLDAGILQSCFAGGMGDYLLIDLPGALAYQAAGHGKLCATFARDGGDIPWSVYYTEGLDAGDTRPVRFARALGRGMAWVNSHDAGSYADVLARLFPKIDWAISVQVVETYRECAMWTSSRIGEASYARWQQGIADAHLTDAPIAYDTLNDGAPTRALEKGVAA